jgi:hypothetical protein
VTGEALRGAIRALLTSHPEISPSKAGHNVHAERYRTSDGANVGFEPERTRHQNLFVEARAVRLSRLADIPHHFYSSTDFGVSKPNHNLFHPEAFGMADIVRFEIRELWQAVRVIAEVAGVRARR